MTGDIAAKRVPDVLIKLVVYTSVGVLSAAAAWVSKYATMTFSSLVVGKLKVDLAVKTLSIRSCDADRMQYGDMQTRMSEDAETLGNFITGDFQNLVVQPLLAIGSIVTIAVINWKMCLVTFSYTPLGMIMAIWLNRKAAERYPRRASTIAESNSLLSQVLDGWDIVKTFGLYETRAGERGAMLSGGQAQRIALARAFLMNPDILVLDEPTSALDALSEKEVLEAMNRLMENRTTLLITHRMHTLRSADVVYNLETIGAIS